MSHAEITHKFRLDVSTLLDLQLPPECIAGIEANCELLRHHARKVEAFALPDDEVGFAATDGTEDGASAAKGTPE